MLGCFRFPVTLWQEVSMLLKMKFYFDFLARVFTTSMWTCFNTPFWSLVLVAARAKNSWQNKNKNKICTKFGHVKTCAVVPSGCSSHGTCLLGISWGGLSKLDSLKGFSFKMNKNRRNTCNIYKCIYIIRRPLAKLEGEARGKDKANANSFR